MSAAQIIFDHYPQLTDEQKLSLYHGLTGADSRAARLCCVISGASETVFFTGSLYLGSAGVERSRYAIPVSLVAYAAGVFAAAAIVR